MRRICLVQRQAHTWVGTADVGPNTQSILTLETLIPFSNNILLATSMSKWHASLFMHTSFNQLCMSIFEPTCVIFDLSDRHWGHIHFAINLMHEIRILEIVWAWISPWLTFQNNRQNKTKNRGTLLSRFHHKVLWLLPQYRHTLGHHWAKDAKLHEQAHAKDGWAWQLFQASQNVPCKILESHHLALGSVRTWGSIQDINPFGM